jgi:hypothetical protein
MGAKDGILPDEAESSMLKKRGISAASFINDVIYDNELTDGVFSGYCSRSGPGNDLSNAQILQSVDISSVIHEGSCNSVTRLSMS